MRPIGADERKVHQERIYTLVCSSEYLKEPSDEYRDELDEKIIVLDYLDKGAVEAKLQSCIEVLNEKGLASWSEYYAALQQDFYVDD